MATVIRGCHSAAALCVFTYFVCLLDSGQIRIGGVFYHFIPLRQRKIYFLQSLMAAWAAADIARKSIGFQQLLYLPVEIRGDLLGFVEHIVFFGSFLGGGLRGNTTLAA